MQETWLRWAERRPGARCATRAPTSCGSSPGRRSTGCARWHAGARTTSVSGCPSRCSPAPDVAEDVESPESLSPFALLTVLETLGPTERAVFVLREVFDVPYDEIAAAVDKSPAAVCQVAHLLCEHVAARRPRMQVGSSRRAAAGGPAVSGRPDRRRPAGPDGRPRTRRGGGQRRRRAGPGIPSTPSKGSSPRRAAAPPGSPAHSRRRRGGRRCGSTAPPRCAWTSTARSTPRCPSSIEDGLITRIFAIRNPEKLNPGSTGRRHR